VPGPTSATMGIWDAFTDIVEAVTPWSVVEAEAPAATQVCGEAHVLIPQAVSTCPIPGCDV
jgi:hypothetical protein